MIILEYWNSSTLPFFHHSSILFPFCAILCLSVLVAFFFFATKSQKHKEPLNIYSFYSIFPFFHYSTSSLFPFFPSIPFIPSIPSIPFFHYLIIETFIVSFFVPWLILIKYSPVVNPVRSRSILPPVYSKSRSCKTYPAG